MFFPALVGKSTGVSIPIDLPIEAILIPGLTEVGGSSTGRPARNAWAKWNGPKVYAARWRRWVRWVRWVQRTIFQPSAFWWVVWLPFPGLKVVKICKNDIVSPTWPFQKVTDLIYPWCVHDSHWQPLTSYVRGGGMQIYYFHLWSRRCLLPRDDQNQSNATYILLNHWYYYNAKLRFISLLLVPAIELYGAAVEESPLYSFDILKWPDSLEERISLTVPSPKWMRSGRPIAYLCTERTTDRSGIVIII